MARARLTAAPEMGNIAHLAGLLGAVMPQRPALWQAINVPRERQRESDWLALRTKVDLLPTPHWGRLWWMLPGGGERQWKGGEGTLLCTMPVLHIPTVTQDGGFLLLAGPQEVVRQSQSYSHCMQRPFAIPLADKWRGDLATCCHLPKSPLTPCIPRASVISKDRPQLHPTPPLGQSFAAVDSLIYTQQQAFFALLDVIIAWLQEYINVGNKLEKQCVACNLILNIKIESMNEIINTDFSQETEGSTSSRLLQLKMVVLMWIISGFLIC